MFPGTTTKTRNEIPILAIVTFVQRAFFKVDFIFTFYLCVGRVGGFVLLSASDGGKQKRVSGFLELQLQLAVSHPA